ncbi:hypothetical protein N0V83_001285 [Neocucurbitaria cava]|uniref:Glycoside hydrolase family 12 protein n=1 Tax=Neocucurbitaria cava TaxID=798079 RepID=A0A9W8YEZ8_9PLEO|nr:hypothetical protein N0V83_001285 [Neocucurbitaria cava]
MAVVALATPTPVAIEKRATTMCGSFKTLATHGYTVYQNNWGAASATSGSQCTTLNSVSSALSFSWSTSWTWAEGKNSVKSYSNIALEHVNKKLSDIKTIPSTWAWKYTGSKLVADVAYDMWLAPCVGCANTYEVMVWLGIYGGAFPISSSGKAIASHTIAGTTWKLFKGYHKDTTVFSFVAPSNINSFDADIKLFFNYLTETQGVSNSHVVTGLQAGTEPFTGSNAVFTTSKYTLKVT